MLACSLIHGTTQALEVFDLMESYEYSPDKSDDKWRDDEKVSGWRGGDGGISADERMAKEEDRTAPTAGEYRSMLHILSHSRDTERGANWERSMELLREAQENELPISESSFQTGMYLHVVCLFFVFQTGRTSTFGGLFWFFKTGVYFMYMRWISLLSSCSVVSFLELFQVV